MGADMPIGGGEDTAEMAEANEANEARAAAWELAAFSFRYPTAELVEAVDAGEWAAAAREIAAALEVELPEGFGDEGIEGDDAATRLTTLRVEATRLFVGSPLPAVSPYEGVWRAEAEGVQPLLYVNPHAMAVERFMKSCGLDRPAGTNEPLDHVATECELLEHLSLRALNPALDEDSPLPAATDLPGGSPEAAYEAFVAEHVAAWMPGFVEAVRAEARVPFYRDAAAFLGALV
ncbi:TorD/DmsD family molecular chaperone [Eggerthella sinensis]|uniref:TorD/DmsD family molecular chaperone n=1 Tax=Eggerthella sinensis TaxID=242230 RepID=UPI001D099978|nr:molecular chaperone TorD family protein [Eggerthella sinensis]MCB7039180.1 molecular chaperone TorD family protein [Eggerthella sinensis]